LLISGRVGVARRRAAAPLDFYMAQFGNPVAALTRVRFGREVQACIAEARAVRPEGLAAQVWEVGDRIG
jgi:hypothetical protein